MLAQALDGRGPHRRRRAARCTRCTRTSCGPATRRCRSSSTSTASATAAASPPAASSPSSTARRSSTWRRRSTSTKTAPTTTTRCPTCPTPDDAAVARASGSSAAPRPARPQRRAGRGRTRSSRSTCATSARRTWLAPTPMRAPDQDMWFRAAARCPTTRCCTRASSRTRPTSRCSAPRRCRTRWPTARPGFMIASLDHVMWFHRPFRADEWLLYHRTARRRPRRAGSRPVGVPRRRHAAVSVAQEGLDAPGALTGCVRAMPSPSGASTSAPTPSPRRRPRCGAAMADAEVGDDALRRGPDRRRLETLAAALLGKEAALYVPSGTMANQLALRLLGVPGTEVLCGERAHVYRLRARRVGGNAGVQLRPLPDADGLLSRRRRRPHALASQQHHLPEISALFLENTHMPASGRPWRAGRGRRGGRRRARATGSRCTATARASGTRRSRSACRRRSSSAACRHRDVLPVEGARRAGRLAALRHRATRSPRRARDRSRLGGGMRQAGVIAAAGIVALETMVERLADDHARARRARRRRSPSAFPGSVDPDAVETNIVCARAERASRPTSARRARGRGVLRRHHRRRHRALRHPQGRRRRRPRPRRSPRSTTWPSAALTPDRYARRSAASDDVPASALAVYAHPDDPEISAGGTLAHVGRPPAPRCGCSITTRGDKGTQDPDADLDALAALRVEETAKAAALLGFAGTFHLDYPDGELVDDHELRGRDRAATSASCGPRSCCAPTHRGVLRRRLLQPPRPPRHRLGHARRGRARGRQPALLPRAPRARGSAVHQVRRGLPVGHARAELLGRHRRHARAQDRRARSATPASSPRRGRLVPRVPARPRRGGRRRRRRAATPSRSASSPSAPDRSAPAGRRAGRQAAGSGGATRPSPAARAPRRCRRRPAPIIAPTNVPTRCGSVGVASSRRRCRSR